MLRPHFPLLKSGDPLRASDINRLTEAARRQAAAAAGSGMFGLQGSDIEFYASNIPFVAGPVEIVRVDGTSAYSKPLYYHQTDGWSLDSDANEQVLCHRILTTTPEVGDRFIAWWHTQRNAWIPLIAGQAAGTQKMIVDFGADDILLVNDETESRANIEFALELAVEEDGDTTWLRIHNRSYVINLWALQPDTRYSTMSGIYSFSLSEGVHQLRLSAFSQLQYDTYADWACVRLEAKGPASSISAHDAWTPLETPSGGQPTAIYRWHKEAEVKNVQNGNLPYFEIAGSNAEIIQVTIPEGGYVIEADVAITCKV